MINLMGIKIIKNIGIISKKTIPKGIGKWLRAADDYCVTGKRKASELVAVGFPGSKQKLRGLAMAGIIKRKSLIDGNGYCSSVDQTLKDIILFTVVNKIV